MSTSLLDDKMPFLEMIQIQSTLESQSPQFFPFKDTNYQAFVKLQKPYTQEDDKIAARRRTTTWEAQIHAPPQPEPESCVTTTHDAAAAKEEGEKPSPSENCRSKRKRTRGIKNKEDVENQRMTHIAVERNRRRQMNDHLGVLRSLMPTSYVQRGDQASIIGGAIDYVKELEQLLQSLEAEKRMRGKEEEIGLSSSYDGRRWWCSEELEGKFGEEVKAEKKSEVGDIEVTVIQRHVNLKVECKRRVGQLVKAIVGIEDLRLTILHLNITSSHSTVLYSFNLKIEEECKLVSASDIAGAVEEIFRFINGS
ncbi:transcription factor bHLH57-like [Senna tora]|uniref:Transcription factor bHLH57-like n=1 Tax=Senna tora TaxID=362788 RepID=A0A834VYB0_9FABA|nr:transcription factor bHLH57-like [Senna tora]